MQTSLIGNNLGALVSRTQTLTRKVRESGHIRNQMLQESNYKQTFLTNV